MPPEDKKPASVLTDALGLAIGSARRLAQLVKTDGRFAYRYDAHLRQEWPGYNVLRHAGCIWALNLADQVRPSRFAEPARLAMNWLIASRMTSSEHGICIEENGNIKLGSNALAILALVSFSEFSEMDRQLVIGLSNYVRAQLNGNGTFIHKRDARTTAIVPFRSDYYDGEALFALLVAATRLGASDQMQFALSALSAHVRQGLGIEQQSHWMMYAVEAGYKISPDPIYVAYADRLIERMLLDKGYRDSENITGIACRTEAFLCYLRMFELLPGRIVDVLASDAFRTIEENITLQLSARLPDGAFRRGLSSSEVRIDYLQHNLISLLGYARLESALNLDTNFSKFSAKET
jgi:hypothetical protein